MRKTRMIQKSNLGRTRMKAEKQYIELMRSILQHGYWVENPRTQSWCKTLLNQRIQFDGNEVPLVTTRKSYWKQAILEMICYIRGYTKLEEFHSLGVHTWDANAANWESDQNPKKDRVGIIYGASAKKTGVTFEDVINQIIQTPHDRGIIWNFWNPEYFDDGCLRPCMFNHQFNVLGDELHLTSTQRSADVPLGLNFNMMQCWFLLNVAANLTGFEVGSITMNLANCHIYENQIELAFEQTKRHILPSPWISGIEEISLDDILKSGNPLAKLTLRDYNHHEAIKYPMTA